MNIQLRRKQILNSSCQYTTKVATVQESRIIELSKYISNHETSDALQLIEDCGYSDELGLFVLMLAQESSQESCGGAA